ncbi:DNA-binding winged helix-turn-helix (wHTH) domain-containing protein [Pragia fontium DSM 5563 = ATCC 49100]|uniref:DNA-binding winged helix-turn-helix (WHTH) domain-containing protein n=2 Tax=Pragia fontium TaxID=82985 RepID=A0AAJ4WDE4_9GAMM|nr:DNA-binding winged helix-turn-helix (wHTH) domain-containing protein [Pragia fontium DSM 5563 = ATCC 49100]VEJ55488.1 DNA-binding transcriptional activator CadC [Pragia fontium]
MTKNYLIDNRVVFYPDEHRLVPVGNHSGVETSLNLPVSRCLLLLIEHQNSIVSKDDFFDKAWMQRGTYVTANTFYQNISLLRKGLKSAGLSEEIIKTVPKKGLMLSGDVKVELYVPSFQATTASQSEKPASTPLITPGLQKEEKEEKGITRVFNLSYRYKIGMFVISIIFLSLLMSYPFFVKQQEKYLDSYKLDSEMNGCQVYTPKKDKNLIRYVEFLQKNNITCLGSRMNTLFITMDKSAEYTSIIRCDSAAISNDTQCDSEFYFRGQNEK